MQSELAADPTKLRELAQQLLGEQDDEDDKK
jgi:hypothetical protein